MVKLPSTAGIRRLGKEVCLESERRLQSAMFSLTIYGFYNTISGGILTARAFAAMLVCKSMLSAREQLKHFQIQMLLVNES